MKMLRRKAQNTVEYAMLIGIVIAALIGMSVYFRNAVAGKWRESADVFGHGRLYNVTESTGDINIDWVLYFGLGLFQIVVDQGSASDLSDGQYALLENCSFSNPTTFSRLCSETKVCASPTILIWYTLKWKLDESEDWRDPCRSIYILP